MLLTSEKRIHPRIEFNQLVRVEPYEGNVLQLIGINYSTVGIAIHGPRPLPLGEFVDLKFKINTLAKKEFNMTAEVMQNQRHSNMYITGLRFLGELNYSS